MGRGTAVVTLVVVMVWAAAGRGTALRGEQRQVPELAGQTVPRCDIPREFGRMVTYIPGDDTGLTGRVTARSANGNALAGQAIFEAQDGTIRWIAVVAPANAGGTDKPALRVMPRNFPVLPIYDCAIGHVWRRP